MKTTPLKHFNLQVTVTYSRDDIFRVNCMARSLKEAEDIATSAIEDGSGYYEEPSGACAEVKCGKYTGQNFSEFADCDTPDKIKIHNKIRSAAKTPPKKMVGAY
jgi:hypothetical protein